MAENSQTDDTRGWASNPILIAAVSAVAYLTTALVLFGDAFSPIGFATLWSARLGLSHWPRVAAGGLALAAVPAFLPVKNQFYHALRLPLFAALGVLLPTVFVGLYADASRRLAIQSFGADEVEDHSFFRSIREAPREFQFYLHAAALKDCRPYAWSYRTMAFYGLSPGVAHNVVPRSWRARCGIRGPN